MIVPVYGGLAIGIAFIIVLSLAINPPFSLRYGHADNATDQDKVRIAEMLDKSKQLEPVRLLLKHYPFATVEIYQYGDFSSEEESDSEFRAIFVYSGLSITRIEYEEVKVNNLLTSYHYPSLLVTVDEQGNLEEISLRCGIRYLGNSGSMVDVIQDYDVVVDFLQSRVCWLA